MIIRAIVFFFCLLTAASAWADEYSEVTLVNFVHTLVRFNAIDPKDDVLLDEYALITDCDLVENFYDNDFRWSQVRQMMRESIKMNVNTYPTAYHYDTTVQLARYDFKDKNFRFTDRTALRSVNTFNFTFNFKPESRCQGRPISFIPLTYNMVIGTPVTIGGLPFSEQDAKALLLRIEAADNTSRTIHVRFNMTVVFIEQLHKSSTPGLNFYNQPGTSHGQPLRIDARLDAVDFYEDADMTKKLYSYTP